MKIYKHKTLLSALLTAALAFSVATARAELRKVEQVVYGMDCAPCAYGLEKGLKKLKGVKDVTVSLNKGTAIVELKPGNKVTVEDIKKIVRKNGFTPKETKILEGTDPAKDESSQPKK
jgi:copper chaperone CopZ